MNKPTRIPHFPNFGSGPTKKFTGWSLEYLSPAFLGRSHRSPIGKQRLQRVIDLTRDVLAIPQDYKIAILPGSATGAIECAFWNLLGTRGIDAYAWDLFGKLWIIDIIDQLKLSDVRQFVAPYGHIPPLEEHDADRDVVFTWNGTTSGVCVPHLDWIKDDRGGLTFCDATSAAFCVPLDWSKLDITTFSWQKGLGGEAAHGMIVLSPRAIDRLMAYTPSWPIPRLFRLKKEGKLIEGVFVGETLNTPSMLCVEDCLRSLEWAEKLGGINGLSQKCQQNFQAIKHFVDKTPWLSFLSTDSRTISPVSVCLTLSHPTYDKETEVNKWRIIREMTSLLSSQNIAHDISNHSFAVPSLRLWAGPTIDREDLEALFPWIEWAYSQVFSTRLCAPKD
jgi:phosphoserine aminotransferase